MQYWLLKSEPEAYSWTDLQNQGTGTWDGVRNYQARNNLRAMKLGDLALFYHSVSGKEVVGICRISAEHFPDETASDGDWSVVQVQPVETFPKPVTLAQIKAEPSLAQIALIRQSRLSVVPLTPDEFQIIHRMGGFEQ